MLTLPVIVGTLASRAAQPALPASGLHHLGALAVAYTLASALQFPLSIVALSGSGLLLISAARTGCLDWRKLYREISWSLFVFISGMFLVVQAVENLA